MIFMMVLALTAFIVGSFGLIALAWHTWRQPRFTAIEPQWDFDAITAAIDRGEACPCCGARWEYKAFFHLDGCAYLRASKLEMRWEGSADTGTLNPGQSAIVDMRDGTVDKFPPDEDYS